LLVRKAIEEGVEDSETEVVEEGILLSQLTQKIEDHNKHNVKKNLTVSDARLSLILLHKSWNTPKRSAVNNFQS
jgi:hypothetical protein